MTHKQFHEDAAKSADAMARRLFAEAGYNAEHPAYLRGLTFDKLASLHHMAANGQLTFDDCPNCHK